MALFDIERFVCEVCKKYMFVGVERCEDLTDIDRVRGKVIYESTKYQYRSTTTTLEKAIVLTP